VFSVLGRRGFLLVEVLVALGVLGVGLAATYAVVLRAHQGMVRAEMVARGTPQILAAMEAGPGEEGERLTPSSALSSAGVQVGWDATGFWLRHPDSGPTRGSEQRFRVPWLLPADGRP
jgi:prepilin-type N-terminal cleavage/methylation domain-containing protein